METGFLCFNPCSYFNAMTALARLVAIDNYEVSVFAQPEKGIRNSYGAIELCPASRGREKTLELPTEPSDL
jgi:hypothetical protein